MAEKNRLQLSYLYGGAVQYQAGEHRGPRVLPDHEFVLILEGNVSYQVQRREYAAPHRTLSLPHLSRVAGVNAKHLCRLFRRSLGHPPIETHRLLRLQLALALLTRSNLTVKQIAHRCGFDDPAYFSRCFMKAFRRSPRAVRKRLAGGLPPPPNPLPVDVSPRLSW